MITKIMSYPLWILTDDIIRTTFLMISSIKKPEEETF
jgi:hypothetical protein